MYSDKGNIGILTSLLLKHGIKDAIVCPGSRNAPIVNNLAESGIQCYGVTDERSAGFQALGLALATDNVVAVCVTSGSAILNLIPAMAEATYRHCGIVVISADRPAERIEQLDGQTIIQHNVLGRYAKTSVTLPEAEDAISRHHCQRLVNEALITARQFPGNVVHINVPISEPLFDFSSPLLPATTAIKEIAPMGTSADTAAEEIMRRICIASRPLILVGQTHYNESLTESIRIISSHITTLYEPLSCGFGGNHFDEVLFKHSNNDDLKPDFVLYAGETVVSKRIKTFLSSCDAEMWEISADGGLHDTFRHLSGVISGDAVKILASLSKLLSNSDLNPIPLWEKTLSKAAIHAKTFKPRYSQMLAVKIVEEELAKANFNFRTHYANSNSVRLGNIYSLHYNYVNRGINGIEGSTSTAAGFSIGFDGITLLVTGDLSFFYDINALWNDNINGNLRILLLNNGGGSIFHSLKGLDDNERNRRLVMGEHLVTARGLCSSYMIDYDTALHSVDLRRKIRRLLTKKTDTPMLLEVLTDGNKDAAEIKRYYETL